MEVCIGMTDLGSSLVRRYLKSKYVRALQKSGARVKILPWPATEAQAEEALAGCDGLLLPGGPDVPPALYGQAQRACCGETNPARDEGELRLLRAAQRRGLPLLGICHGLQLLNVAYGGTLYQDIAAEAPGEHHKHSDILRKNQAVHTVHLTPGSRLQAICGEEKFGVNTLHHQAVDAIGEGLRVTAMSDDGLVEGLETAQEPFCVAVQWHPEHLFAHDAISKRLFAAFLAAAAAKAAGTSPQAAAQKHS